jgi:hypothetical protein
MDGGPDTSATGEEARLDKSRSGIRQVFEPDTASQVFVGSRTASEDKSPGQERTGGGKARHAFKTGERAKARWRVRFPSASATRRGVLQAWTQLRGSRDHDRLAGHSGVERSVRGNAAACRSASAVRADRLIGAIRKLIPPLSPSHFSAGDHARLALPHLGIGGETDAAQTRGDGEEV